MEKKMENEMETALYKMVIYKDSMCYSLNSLKEVI